MSKARAKGTSFETAVVNYLKGNGFEDAERWGTTNNALGDLRNVPLVLECKNHKKMTLSEWCKQAEAASEKTGQLWAVVHHRPRKNVSQAYVTQSLEQWAVLMKAYRYCLENGIDLNI